MKDKIFYNGNIITMTGENDTVEAVLIRNGKIEKTGSLSDVKGCSSQAELVNLDGKTLMPSFVDGHSHFASIGKMEKTTVDLMDCKNFDEIVERIKAFIKKYNIPEGKVVSGRGYDHNELEEKTSPTKEILDMASSKHPIIVSHVSGHIGCVNTLALKLKGITRETQYKEGGVICHDEQGEVTGVLEEGAFFDMRALAEKPSKEEEKELILAGQEVYAKYGITTVQNGGAYAADTKLLTELAQEDKYKLDVVSYMMFAVTSKEEMEKYKEYQGKYVNHFKIGGYKLFMDGSPQCKTAWLSRPYEGEKEYCGYPILTDEQALSYIQRAIDENQQLLVHCNGDQASEQFITSYEKAKDTNGLKSKLRPVMIHSQTVRDDQLDRMKKLGMMPSFFIGHTYFWGDVHLKNMGQERGNHISPIRAALDRRIIANLHQDSPVTPPNMLLSIWCAVNRISKNGKVIGIEQRITPYEALYAATAGGAYEYFEENEKGTIEEGKRADLIILDENPLAVDPMMIKDIKVLTTIKDGMIIYEA